MSFHATLSKAHRWIALILGLQILFWTVGGVVMSWIPIEDVRGEHLVTRSAATALPYPLPDLAGQGGVSLSGRSLGGTPYIVQSKADGGKTLLDAKTGKPVPVTEQMIKRVVSDALIQPHAVAQVRLLTGKAPLDYRRTMPVWRADVPTANGLRVYLSPDTGDILSVRTDTWRIYDFFWMLHIMDYDNRDDFNNPLVMIFSLSAALFTLSGLGLLVFRLGPDLRRLRRRFFA